MKKMYNLIHGKDATFISYLFLASLLLISPLARGQGNGTLACNKHIQVSLDGNCEADITADMILEGTYSDLSMFTVNIKGVVGSVVTQVGDYEVSVTDNDTGNSCWGFMSVEDKLPPIIENCPCEEDNTDPDCQFLCSDLDGILNGTIKGPEPVVNENCTTFVTYTDDDLRDFGCFGQTLIRTYYFEDDYGNVSLPCKVYYYFAPLEIEDVTPPTAKVELPCGNGTSMQEIYDYFEPIVGAEQALINAYPTVDGAIVNNQGPCNIIATKTDISQPVCGPNCKESFKMVRTWSIIDWCSDETRTLVQIISTKDREAPTIEAKDVTSSVNPWNCEATIRFDPPTILHDNCDENVRYRVEGPAGVSINYDSVTDRWTALNVPKGIQDFYYIAEDCCGNEGIDTIEVDVADRSAPVAISKENIVISLTRESGKDGIAKLFPRSVDNGSHDGCTEVHLEIRREGNLCDHPGNLTYNNDGHPEDDPNDPDDGQFVKFCCEDLTEMSPEGVPFGRVKVWLRVWDDADMDNEFGSAGDNYNETWSWVRVEDKLPPTISCPPDVTLECHEDYLDLEKTGEATAHYTCTTGMVDFEDDKDLNECGSGTVVRKWFVVGQPNLFCFQNITIREGDFFDPNTIEYPDDVTTDCMNLGEKYQVTWGDAKCSRLGVSVQSDTFQFVEDVCFKIVNRYTVIDWCIYDPNSQSTRGMWTGTQIIKVVDDIKPTVMCKDTMFAANDLSDIDNDGETCEATDITLTASAADEGDCSSNWLRWTIFVDLWGDGISEYEYTSFVGASDRTFDDDNGNGVPDIYIGATNSNEQVSITIPEDIAGSMSNHKVTWKVTDGCGNHRSCTSTFMVVDKKKPTPYCISLSSAVMDNGQVELWARDFDKGSFDNCSAQEDLLFTFENESPVPSRINEEHFFKGNGQTATAAEYNEGDAQKWVPSFNSSSRIFDCDNIPVTEVRMTVWDEKGEHDFCIVTLSLKDNHGACDSTSRVGLSGLITGADNEAMKNVTVILDNDQLVGYPKETTTDDLGLFVFDNTPSSVDYNLSVSKNDDHMNGLSTLDLVLIQRHILNIQKLDNPYYVIAADVNNDQKVRSNDLVELRKLILGINDQLENSESWRFLDRAQTFNDNNQPWPINESIALNNINGDLADLNFIGQKVGDVNGSAKPNFNANETSPRSKDVVSVIIEDQAVIQGEVVDIAINAKDAMSIYGAQFTLDLQGAVLLEASSDLIEEGQILYHALNTDKFVFSLSRAGLMDIAQGDELITVKIRAQKDGKLSDCIAINSSSRKAEAYQSDFLEADLQLLFKRSAPSEDEFTLLQNEPNPFSDQTNIRFNMPNQGQVSMRLTTIDGQVVWNEKATFDKGAQNYTLSKGLFPSSGVYMLTLSHDAYSSTIKLIHLK